MLRWRGGRASGWLGRLESNTTKLICLEWKHSRQCAHQKKECQWWLAQKGYVLKWCSRTLTHQFPNSSTIKTSRVFTLVIHRVSRILITLKICASSFSKQNDKKRNIPRATTLLSNASQYRHTHSDEVSMLRFYLSCNERILHAFYLTLPCTSIVYIRQHPCCWHHLPAFVFSISLIQK